MLKRLLVALCALLIFVSPLSYAAGAIVNDVYTDDGLAGASGTTYAITITGVTTGNTLVVQFTWGGMTGYLQTISSVSDGSSYSVAETARTDIPNNQVSEIFYLSNVSSGSHTITATFSAAVQYRAAHVFEVSGLATSSALDQGTGQYQLSAGTGTDGVSSGATSATTNANDFVMGFTVETTNGTGAGTTAGTGYTLIGSAHFLTGEWKNVSATGAQTATFTQSANDTRITQVVALKQAAGAASSKLPILIPQFY